MHVNDHAVQAAKCATIVVRELFGMSDSDDKSKS